MAYLSGQNCYGVRLRNHIYIYIYIYIFRKIACCDNTYVFIKKIYRKRRKEIKNMIIYNETWTRNRTKRCEDINIK